MLLTADHGQVDVHPNRMDYLDELWPQLPELLSHPRPAGSARDVFLHVKEDQRDAVLDGLRDRLQDRAIVCPAPDLFPQISDALAERLGDIAVMPAAGRMAWMRSATGVETWNLGQHGGREAEETTIYLAEVQND